MTRLLRRKHTLVSLVALAAAICALASGSPALGKGAGAAAPGRAPVLTLGGYWRWHLSWRRPEIERKSAARSGADAAPAVLPLWQYESPPPPASWPDWDFDDGAWPRSQGRTLSSSAFADFQAFRVCLRGTFAVTDRAAIKGLSLSGVCRGGVVVYLNGQEVARAHMPEGPLTPRTPATPYPDHLFVDAQGKPYPPISSYHASQRIRAGDKALERRIRARDRQFGPLALPLDALRKGTNVLAVEVRRSDYHPATRTWFYAKYGKVRWRPGAWVPCDLLQLRLEAVGSGVVPNVSRPRGVRVWNVDRNDRGSVPDYGDPNEPLRPIRLVGARNGVFSGQVVVGSREAVKGLRAEVSGLSQREGGGTIPPERIEVRYARADGKAYAKATWFDGLQRPAPPEVPVTTEAAGAIQPLWVTVSVPREAVAGAYTGTLTISADGLPQVAVPIHLDVADWALPDPVHFRTHASIYQSPTSLALQAKVPEWSERHWSLMEKSLALLGQVGNKLVNITVVDQTQFGNDEGMVYWIRRPDGTFTYDFAVLDRYLELVKKHLGTPPFVAVHVWHAGGWGGRGAGQKCTVTVVDAKTGRREHMQVPVFGTAESKAFWTPVLHQLKVRLAKAGLEKSMCIGILSDEVPPPAVASMFNEILPGVGWFKGCHRSTRSDKPVPLRGGGTIVLWEYVYGPTVRHPAEALPKLPAFWRYRGPGVRYFRSEFDTMSLQSYRTLPERGLYQGTRGFGRIGLDFWPVIKDRRGRLRHIYNRWPHSSCAQRRPNMFRLTWPGPDGAEPTLRFEALREGMQEAEAVFLIAEALDAHADALGQDLAARCRQLLFDRINYAAHRYDVIWAKVFFHTNHLGWQDLAGRLYRTAGEVARALRSRGTAERRME